MTYTAANAEVVAEAQKISDQAWESIPIVTIPYGTNLHASVEELSESVIGKVVSGSEPIRDGYITKLYRTENGDLHIVDGHYRAAMYAALGKDMPARIATATNH
jgi:predicted polyphosphate/ATP-dependent NAD kinase